MLNVETKRKIDAARDVLVGKVPDPKGQIDQITNALIYKFMDDMDEKARSIGGNATFFTGDLKKYAWKNLMDPSLGAQEKLNIYSEALEKFSTSENLPKLFRDIFRQAYLPYRDPNTLNLFLKEIDYFDYAHSEDLGDAFEYLLSVMGSQGDAGQFRTPRHIIDFIVKVVAPTKDETILDPACGTAGFLISAYKHILADHDGLDNKTGEKANSEKRLTYSEKQKLMEHLVGYDISPDMAKLARVNMYLHGAKNPNIFEYDSLSSDTRWEENFDVILANPPFMTPKGGIVPHKRFGVESNRAEVLFLDYIKEHLTQNGRAGIVIPEGIIFQSGKAYKSLRKSLVDNNFLVAVISLPSGVFQPYSGVKTSVLIIDKKLAKQKEEILFIKVENDGYDLGSQRREINKNNLPEALEILNAWKNGEKKKSDKVQYVSKKDIAKNEDYNLSGDRYKIQTDYSNAKWPMVELGEVCELGRGFAFKSDDYISEGVLNFRVTNINSDGSIDLTNSKYLPVDFADKYKSYLLQPDDFVIVMVGATVGKIGRIPKDILPALLNQNMWKFIPDEKKINKDFLFYLVKNIEVISQGGAQGYLTQSEFIKKKIPLPPLEIQEQIVREIEGYQKIIDGAKMVVENWKPKINIDLNWEKRKLENICEIHKGSFSSTKTPNGEYPLVLTATDRKTANKYDFDGEAVLIPLISATGHGKADLRNIHYQNGKFAASNLLAVLISKKTDLNMKFLRDYLFQEKDIIAKKYMQGAANVSMKREQLNDFEIYLPSFDFQNEYINKKEIEEELIGGNERLIEIYDSKISILVTKLWD